MNFLNILSRQFIIEKAEKKLRRIIKKNVNYYCLVDALHRVLYIKQSAGIYISGNRSNICYNQKFHKRYLIKQAGAELCQAQVQLEVVVEVAVKFRS